MAKAIAEAIAKAGFWREPTKEALAGSLGGKPKDVNKRLEEVVWQKRFCCSVRAS